MGGRRKLEGNTEDLVKAMKESKNPNEYRRIQSVYLGIKNPQMPAREVSVKHGTPKMGDHKRPLIFH